MYINSNLHRKSSTNWAEENACKRRNKNKKFIKSFQSQFLTLITFFDFCSLHRNLLIATVLQKARFIFMEEAFQLHGHYLNQQNTKLLQMHLHRQQQLQQHSHVSDSKSMLEESHDDSELDSIFSEAVPLTPHDSHVSNEEVVNKNDKENSPPAPTLIYLDLDNNRVRAETSSPTESTSSNKRRRSVSEWEQEEAISSILPKAKQVKYSQEDELSDDESDASELTSDTCLSLDFLSHELPASKMPPDTSNSSSIERITSLVSIFNFGNLQRSVSQPDLCSKDSGENNCCMAQRYDIAMTVWKRVCETKTVCWCILLRLGRFLSDDLEENWWICYFHIDLLHQFVTSIHFATLFWYFYLSFNKLIQIHHCNLTHIIFRLAHTYNCQQKPIMKLFIFKKNWKMVKKHNKKVSYIFFCDFTLKFKSLLLLDNYVFRFVVLFSMGVNIWINAKTDRLKSYMYFHSFRIVEWNANQKIWNNIKTPSRLVNIVQ